MPKMSKSNIGLLFLIALSGILHIGYSVLENLPILNGVAFSRGVILMSDNSQIYYNRRMEIKDGGLYEFMQSGTWYYDAYRKLVSTALGGVRTVTVSSGFPPHGEPPKYTDEEVVFTAAYFNKIGAPLTFYKIKLANTDSKCFYTLELQQLRCVGRERPRNPLHPESLGVSGIKH